MSTDMMKFLPSDIPVKEEFTSKGGSYIPLGKFKNKTSGQATFKNSFLSHSTSTEIVQPAQFDKGLTQTRFHKGFQRRSESNIINPIADQQKLHDQAFYQKQQRTSEIRTRELRNRDNNVGYDIITHTSRRAGLKHRPEGIKPVEGHGRGPESIQRGKAILRDSANRFFTPTATGPAAQYRQDILYREGILQEKHSSALQLGKKDFKSYGVEDQFSKSQYTNNSTKAQTGLAETRQPGRFTPRKVSNPCGDPEVVRNWSSTLDLNNKTFSNSNSLGYSRSSFGASW